MERLNTSPYIPILPDLPRSPVEPHALFKSYIQACFDGDPKEKDLRNQLKKNPGIDEALLIELICSDNDLIVQLKDRSLWLLIFDSLPSSCQVSVEYKGRDSRFLSALAVRCLAGTDILNWFPHLEEVLQGEEVTFDLKFESNQRAFIAYKLNIFSLFFLSQPEAFSSLSKAGQIQAISPCLTNQSDDPVEYGASLQTQNNHSPGCLPLFARRHF